MLYKLPIRTSPGCDMNIARHAVVILYKRKHKLHIIMHRQSHHTEIVSLKQFIKLLITSLLHWCFLIRVFSHCTGTILLRQLLKTFNYNFLHAF